MQFYFLILFLFFSSALADYTELVYYWQLKEYRGDRFNDFLGTVLGKQFILSYKIIFRPILFLIFIFSFQTFSILAFLFLIDIFKTLISILRHRFTRPKFTAKAILIVFFSLVAEAAILFSGFLFLAFSRFIILSLIIGLINLAGGAIKKIYYRRARTKLARYKNITVIGVTGSYGKTTVKNFLEQVLKSKFQVIKTPKNINTELGIARFILQTDFNKIDIFIVEMAAYKIGEIRQICEIVEPKIGILTAINDQHLALFGTIKNTRSAKYELLRSLPPAGLAIVNSDNPYCRGFIHELSCQVKTFGQLAEFKPNLLIRDITAGANHLEFKANGYEIKTNVIGAHNAMNIAPVILTAEYLKLSKEQIETQAKQLKLPESTMQIVNYGKCIIIDDSYNSNPEAFSVALKFLDDYKTAGKKIVVTRGMIELGTASNEAHKKIGRQIAKTAAELIIISPDQISMLKAGIGQSKIKIQSIFGMMQLLEFIKDNKNKSSVILLEGRMPEIIIKEINHNK